MKLSRIVIAAICVLPIWLRAAARVQESEHAVHARCATDLVVACKNNVSFKELFAEASKRGIDLQAELLDSQTRHFDIKRLLGEAALNGNATMVEALMEDYKKKRELTEPAENDLLELRDLQSALHGAIRAGSVQCFQALCQLDRPLFLAVCGEYAGSTKKGNILHVIASRLRWVNREVELVDILNCLHNRLGKDQFLKLACQGDARGFVPLMLAGTGLFIQHMERILGSEETRKLARGRTERGYTIMHSLNPEENTGVFIALCKLFDDPSEINELLSARSDSGDAVSPLDCIVNNQGYPADWERRHVWLLKQIYNHIGRWNFCSRFSESDLLLNADGDCFGLPKGMVQFLEQHLEEFEELPYMKKKGKANPRVQLPALWHSINVGSVSKCEKGASREEVQRKLVEDIMERSSQAVVATIFHRKFADVEDVKILLGNDSTKLQIVRWFLGNDFFDRRNFHGRVPLASSLLKSGGDVVGFLKYLHKRVGPEFFAKLARARDFAGYEVIMFLLKSSEQKEVFDALLELTAGCPNIVREPIKVLKPTEWDSYGEPRFAGVITLFQKRLERDGKASDVPSESLQTPAQLVGWLFERFRKDDIVDELKRHEISYPNLVCYLAAQRELYEDHWKSLEKHFLNKDVTAEDAKFTYEDACKVDNAGYTLFHHAAANNHKIIFEWFFRKGKTRFYHMLGLQSKDDGTPLDIARKNDAQDVLTYLKEKIAEKTPREHLLTLALGHKVEELESFVRNPLAGLVVDDYHHVMTFDYGADRELSNRELAILSEGLEQQLRIQLALTRNAN